MWFQYFNTNFSQELQDYAVENQGRGKGNSHWEVVLKLF